MFVKFIKIKKDILKIIKKIIKYICKNILKIYNERRIQNEIKKIEIKNREIHLNFSYLLCFFFIYLI